MASNSKNLYCANKPSSSPYVLAVSFSEESPSVANNTSVITVSGSLKASTGANWDANYDSYLRIYWYDNRTAKETLLKSITFRAIALGGIKSLSSSITVTHNSDGSLSGYAKVAFEAGSTSGGWCPASNSVATATTALTAIARASTVSSISGTNLGAAVTVNISRAVSTFTHKVEYKYGDSAWTTAATAATTSATFTPPISLASQYPNATTGVLTVRVTTLNGTATIGSAVTATKNIGIPASVVPTFTSITATRVDNGVPAAWGVYVKGYSKATVAINGAAGANGSTIQSYSITGGGLSSTDSSATTGVLQSAETVTFTGKITDSRGRTASKTVSITVVDYFKPSIALTVARCNSSGAVTASGTYLKVTCTYKYASVSSKNTITRSVSCNSVSNTAFTSGTAFVLAANCSIGSTYTVTATITDGLGNKDTITAIVPTDVRAINIKKNKKGVAIGGFATVDNTFDVYWASKFRKDVTIDTNLKVTGAITGKVKAVDLGSMSGKTIADLRTTLDNLLTNNLNYGVQAYFTAGSWTSLWNANDLTTAIAAGSRYTVNVVATYSQNTYCHLLIGNYSDGAMYMLHKSSGTWGKIHKITHDSTPASSIPATGGNVQSELTKLNKSYIQEQGTSGIWTYRKWSDGTAECWTTNGWQSDNVYITNASWSGGFESPYIALPNYPFAFTSIPFSEVRYVGADGAASGDCMIIHSGRDMGQALHKTAPQKFKMWRGTTGTFGHPVFTCYAIGKWK